MSISSTLRLSGLATGLDTDQIIKDLMTVERLPLDKLEQEKQILEWKKDDYREITNFLRTFKDDYFDILKPSTNMTSSSAYSKFTITSSDSTVVTASANADAVGGTHTITVTQIASAANTKSVGSVSKSLTGGLAAELDYTGANEFNIDLNGVTKTITLKDGVYADVNDLINNATDGLQKLVDDAFGAGKITVSESAGVLTFDTTNGKVEVTSGTNDALTKLGFTNAQSNKINLSDTLENIALQTPMTFDVSGNIAFTINGKYFTFDKTDTMTEVMDEINSSTAGVKLAYSELTDEFTLTANQKGAGDNITITNTTGNLFGAGSAIGITDSLVNNGTDAIFNLDGVNNIVRNDNNFTIDGVAYTLKDTGGPNTVTLEQDVDGIYDNIKTFIEAYNSLLDKVNGELSEERDRDYQPLTDDQKEAMSDNDIELWEEKAKSGLLRNDNILEKIVSDMRVAIYDSISNVSGTLSDIGITTGNYLDKGKLVIDENKLKDAIKTQPQKVQNLFSKQSSIDYDPTMTSGERSIRYNEEGIVNRLHDIIQDNIRTIRDNDGKKGSLIEKAGIIGDISEFTNSIDTDITNTEQEIDDLLDLLVMKEDNYYRKFSALETAINAMNNQSMWLMQQLGM